MRCDLGNRDAVSDLHAGVPMAEGVWVVMGDAGRLARSAHDVLEDVPCRAGEYAAFGSPIVGWRGSCDQPHEFLGDCDPSARRRGLAVANAEPALRLVDVAPFEVTY